VSTSANLSGLRAQPCIDDPYLESVAEQRGSKIGELERRLVSSPVPGQGGLQKEEPTPHG
jgi:hypothetical protein